MRPTLPAEAAVEAAAPSASAGGGPRPAAGPGPAIVAEGLVKRFGEVTALDGVSFSVPYGSVVGLLGPNGSGKTTTSRILTTLLVPDAGRVVIDGVDAVKEPERARPLIGMAGQYAAVDPNLTGRENLVMVGRLARLPRRVARERAAELLEQFRLQEIADRPSRTYSGGQRRRFDLAAALVHRPKILFFDEPTTGLDPRSRRDLWTILEKLVADGTTILLTTQYLEEADHLADHLVVIDRGRIIAQGTPAQLKADLGASVVDVRFADEATAARAAEVLSAGHRTTQRGEHVEIPVSADADAAMGILLTLQAHGLSPAGFVLREPSLDDVFLALTGRATTETTETTDNQEAAQR
jgi:daunorubicin resistance ABC transporter ATP-binding subunit